MLRWKLIFVREIMVLQNATLIIGLNAQETEMNMPA